MLDPNFTSRKVWFLSGLKIKYGRHKSPNLIELVILLQIYQFLISFEIGNDLASIPSRQLFILAVAGLTILPISFHFLFYYLWKTGQEKINAVAAEILPISIPRSYLFIFLFVIISTVVNAIGEQTGVPKIFLDISRFNDISANIVCYSIPIRGFKDIYCFLLYLLYLKVILGLILI